MTCTKWISMAALACALVGCRENNTDWMDEPRTSQEESAADSSEDEDESSEEERDEGSRDEEREEETEEPAEEEPREREPNEDRDPGDEPPSRPAEPEEDVFADDGCPRGTTCVDVSVAFVCALDGDEGAPECNSDDDCTDIPGSECTPYEGRNYCVRFCEEPEPEIERTEDGLPITDRCPRGTECVDVSVALVCAFEGDDTAPECNSDDDCADIPGSECTPYEGREYCVLLCR